MYAPAFDVPDRQRRTAASERWEFGVPDRRRLTAASERPAFADDRMKGSPVAPERPAFTMDPRSVAAGHTALTAFIATAWRVTRSGA